jgi:sphingolipid delta-4 desaturase
VSAFEGRGADVPTWQPGGLRAPISTAAPSKFVPLPFRFTLLLRLLSEAADTLDSSPISSMTVEVAPTPSRQRRTEFYRSTEDEPHILRRKQILEKHPEIEKLFGHDSRPVPIVICLVLSQVAIAYFQKSWSWGMFFLVAYAYGGTVAHSLSLMTHEVSHNLVFAGKEANEAFGIFCNIGMGLPSSTMFKRYHMEHHLFQGDDERDVDIPTYWEGNVFTNSVLKLIWLMLQPLFYSIRPLIIRPKTPMAADMINNATILLSDAMIFYFCGWRGVFYLVMSTLLGLGLHPCAGHFVSEHYVFTEGYETYSYYGPLNLVCWNVGYHNEHHDFPRVPGWRLPQVKAMAPEFYDNLPCYTSWTYVLFKYITDPSIGPFSRVRRSKISSKNQ